MVWQLIKPLCCLVGCVFWFVQLFVCSFVCSFVLLYLFSGLSWRKASGDRDIGAVRLALRQLQLHPRARGHARVDQVGAFLSFASSLAGEAWGWDHDGGWDWGSHWNRGRDYDWGWDYDRGWGMVFGWGLDVDRGWEWCLVGNGVGGGG